MPSASSSSKATESTRYHVFLPPPLLAPGRPSRGAWSRTEEQWKRTERSDTSRSSRWEQSDRATNQPPSISHTRFGPLIDSPLPARPAASASPAHVGTPLVSPGQGRAHSQRQASPARLQEGEDMTSWTETFVRGLVQGEADATRQADEGAADMTEGPFSLGTVAVGDALRAVNAEDDGVTIANIHTDAYRSGTQAEEAISDALRATSPEQEQRREEEQHQQMSVEDTSTTTSRVRFVTAKAMLASTQFANANAEGRVGRARPPLVVIGSQSQELSIEGEADEAPEPAREQQAGKGRLVVLQPRPAIAHKKASQQSSMDSYGSRSYPSVDYSADTQSQSLRQRESQQQQPSQDSQSNSLDAALRSAAKTTPVSPHPPQRSHTDPDVSAKLPRRSARSRSDGDAGRKRNRDILGESSEDSGSALRLVKAPRVEKAAPPTRRSGLVIVEPRARASPAASAPREDHEVSRFASSSSSRLVFVQPATTKGTPRSGTAARRSDDSSRLASTSAAPPPSRPSRLAVAHYPDSMMNTSTDASMTSSSNGADSIPPPPTLRFDPSSVTSLSTIARQPQLFLAEHQGGPRGQTSPVRFNVLALVREIGSLDEVSTKVYRGGKVVEGRLERTFRSYLLLQDGRGGSLLKVTLWGECARVWAALDGDDDSGSMGDESSLAAANNTTAAGMSTLLRGRAEPPRQAALRQGDVVFLESLILSRSGEGYEGSASARTDSSVELCWRWDVRGEGDRRRYTFDPELASLDRRCRDVWRCAQLWQRGR